MPAGYDSTKVEAKWQKKWEEAKVFEVDFKKAKNPYYGLVMYPYPSGDKLHVGHWYNFGPADSYFRFQRMQGKDVFTPMGFDAFGLPAENYAIKTGIHPDESTRKNVETMVRQLKRMGCMYDWSKTLNTSEPEYYRWTQWLFLQMFKNGLAYQKEGMVNFCPECQTVLANEQVWDGKCERCESDVVQKPLKQWYWRITKYAQRMLEGLEKIDWPGRTKIMQENWIGHSEGTDVEFEVAGIKRGIIPWGKGLKPKVSCTVNRGLKAAVNEHERGLQPVVRTVHLTIEPKKREALFKNEVTACSMLRMIGRVAKRHEIVLHEACVMSDHVHLLVTFVKGRHLERDILRILKGGSANDYNKRFERTGALWARGGHFEEVNSEDQFVSVIDYIQKNPKRENIDGGCRILSHLPITLTVFTTRVDTLPSGTYMVLAPENELVDILTTSECKNEVEKYKKEAAKKTELQRTDLEKEKTGVFTGSYVINPITGERMPIWISDFVIAHYGYGAVFADAHDERDFEFAKKYGIALKTNLRPADGSDDSKIRNLTECFTGDGVLYNSGGFDGLTSAEARKAITRWLEKKKKGRAVVQYRIRDWTISRQRYWGALIPVVYDPDGKAHPVPEEHLPWKLPTDVEFKPTGISPIAQSKELKKRVEKIFGKGWTPEVDTMDTFVCSSFYQFMYLNTDGFGVRSSESGVRDNKFVDKDIEKKWMPVDMYIGGAEHACMHLIYARFVTMALKGFGYVSVDEPFRALVHQGIITNEGAKMSKSKGNVVSPDEFIEKYGSDVFRMYLMFMGPFTEGGDWSETGIKGISRFAQKAYKIIVQSKKCDQDKALTAGLHAAIKKVTEDVGRLHFNTAISALMEFLNACEKHGGIDEESAKTFCKLLAPLAPHLSEELWENLGGKGFVIEQIWPKYDPKLIVTDTVTIAVQVNGKVRGDFEVSSDISEKDAIAQAKEVPNVKKHLEGKKVKKEVYVEGELVSLVV